MSKILGALKLAGLSLALCGGTICEAIGLPLIFVGQSKSDKALETFVNSQEYQIIRQAEDERLDLVQERLDELEQNYLSGQMPSVEYNYLKNAYEEDIKNSEDGFLKQAFEEHATEEQKNMVSTGDGMQIAGYVLAGVGGLALGFKAYSFVYGSIKLGEPTEVIGEAIVETMSDVVWEDFDFEERKQKREEKKKAKEQKKDEPFIDDGEDELGNIEDSCYNE